MKYKPIKSGGQRIIVPDLPRQASLGPLLI